MPISCAPGQLGASNLVPLGRDSVQLQAHPITQARAQAGGRLSSKAIALIRTKAVMEMCPAGTL